MNVNSPKDVKSRRRKKIVTRVAFKLVAVRSISSSLLWKHQIPLIFKMFPAGSQLGLYFPLFPLFLVKYGSVFILSLCLETGFFYPLTCAAFVLYSEVSNLQDRYMEGCFWYRFINIQGQGSRHTFSVSSGPLFSCTMWETIIFRRLNKNRKTDLEKRSYMGFWKLVRYPEIRLTDWRMVLEN